jgi:hypothetical protein
MKRVSGGGPFYHVWANVIIKQLLRLMTADRIRRRPGGIVSWVGTKVAFFGSQNKEIRK